MGFTVSHPYTTALIALGFSFLPTIGIAGLMLGALLRGDRPWSEPRLQVQVPNSGTRSRWGVPLPATAQGS